MNTRLRVVIALVSIVFAASALIGKAQTASGSESNDPLDAILARISAYVDSFERGLASVVVEENLTQQTTVGRSPGVQQVTRADLLLLRIAGRDAWQAFRDVFEVNGRAVRDHDDRLRRLFLDSPANALDSAQRIAAESSRYNIGAVIRTIDVPTFGLMLLRPEYRDRLQFTKRQEEAIVGTRVLRIDWVERRRPTIVRTLRGDGVPLEGSIWIVPASGQVVRTLVKVQGTPDPGVRFPPANGTLLMWVMVTFTQNADLKVWVPEQMDEVAMTADRSSVTVTALYSNIRRFDVHTSTSFDHP